MWEKWMKQSLFCRSTDILLVKIQSNVEMIRWRYYQGSYVTCSSNGKMITKCTMPNLTNLNTKLLECIAFMYSKDHKWCTGIPQFMTNKKTVESENHIKSNIVEIETAEIEECLYWVLNQQHHLASSCMIWLFKCVTGKLKLLRVEHWHYRLV